MVSWRNDDSSEGLDGCGCLYTEDNAPSIDLLASFSNALTLGAGVQSPPKFSITSTGNTKALGLDKGSDCKSEELSVELQDLVAGAPCQQF